MLKNDKTTNNVNAEVKDVNETETAKESKIKKAKDKVVNFIRANKKTAIGAAVGAVGTLAGLAYLGSKSSDNTVKITIEEAEDSVTE